jgi:dUTPase
VAAAPAAGVTDGGPRPTELPSSYDRLAACTLERRTGTHCFAGQPTLSSCDLNNDDDEQYYDAEDNLEDNEVYHDACGDLEEDGHPSDGAGEIEAGRREDILAYFNSLGVNEDRAYQKLTFLGGPTTDAQDSPKPQGLSLIDSGNMVGSAINADHLLGQLPWINITPYSCPTARAAQGAALDILGLTEPLTFAFHGCPGTFTEQFTVIRNLTHEVNLGRAFLKQHKAVFDFQRDQVQMRRGDQPQRKVRVQLHGPSGPSHAGDGVAFVYSQVRARIPAGCAKYIPVAVPALRERVDIVIEPIDSTRNPALLAKSIGGLEGSKTWAVVYNPLDRDLHLDKWCRMGQATVVGQTVDDSQAVLGEMSYQDESVGGPHHGSGDHQKEYLDKGGDLYEQRKWMNEQFRLKESSHLVGDPEAMSKVEDLLVEFSDTVSKHKTDYGKTDLVELNIDLVPGAKPFKGRARPLNPKQESDLEDQLEAWTREDVIEPANSPWAAPLIAAIKKDGRIRWCIDFRKLNDVTVKDSYPLPLITANLHKMGKAVIFTTLDGTGAYHNISIAEGDRPLTAFIAPMGQWQFKRMPFGLCNAPQAYSRLVEMVLRGIDPRFVLAYIDDIICFTATMDQHLDILRQVLTAHRRAGLKIAPAKSYICRDKVDYLGHQVSSGGIEMIENYVDLLVNWPKPETPRQLATFLGKAGYYRQFIKGYGELVACLEAEKKKTELVWSKAMETAFLKIKEAFSTKPILAFPDFDSGKPFIMDTDFCQEGMGQVLSQEQQGDDGMRERVIGCSGRKCTTAERNYPSNKGETASFVAGLEKYEHLLRYKPFKARVDNRCLTYIRNLKKPTGIWNRWLEFIDSFQFEIQHRAGRKHANADSLSRAEHLPDPTMEEVESSKEFLCSIGHTGQTVDYLCSMVEQLNDATLAAIQGEAEKEHILPLTNKQLRRAQRDDPDLRRVSEWVQKGVKPNKQQRRIESKVFQQYMQDFELLYIHKGLLYRKVLVNEERLGPNDRLCLAKGLKDTALYWAHAHDSVGHLGIGATQKRMKARFHFPGLYNQTEEFVLGCHRCLQKRGMPARVNVPPQNNQRGFPGARWSLDLVGPMPTSDQGHNYILTAEDVFTRWPVAVGITDKSAQGIARAFDKHVIAEHGSCHELLTDNALELTGHVINDVARILGINKVQTIPYNPNGNKVERWHRTLGQILRTAVARDQTDWEDKLPAALLAYRSSVHKTTKKTPFYLTHGREAQLPIDIIFPRPPQAESMHTTYGVDMRRNMAEAFEFVRDQQKKIIKREVDVSDGSLEGRQLKEGDLVWYYSPLQKPQTVKKLHQGWLGPFAVTKVLSEVSYLITPHGDWTKHRPMIPCVIHRLLRYYPDTAKPTLYVEATEKEIIDEMVDQVDGNLEASGEIVVPIQWTEQHSATPISVSYSVEEAEMVDVGLIDKRKEGKRDTAVVDKTVPLCDQESMLDGEQSAAIDPRLADTLVSGPTAAVAQQCRPYVIDRHVDTGDGAMSTEAARAVATQQQPYTTTAHVDNTGLSQSAASSDTVPVAGGALPTADDHPLVDQVGVVTRRQASLAREKKEMGGSTGLLGDTVTRQRRVPSAQSLGVTRRRVTDVQAGVLPVTSPLPPYLAPAAEQAAVGSSSKRAREEEEAPLPDALKQLRFDPGINALSIDNMADAYASMNIRSLRVRVDGPDTNDGAESGTFVGMPRSGPDIPHNRIMVVPGGQMPVRGSVNAAGQDTFARVHMRIPQGTTMAVPLGFKIAPGTGIYIRLAETSSWACSHPMYLLRAGVIDPDFRGELCALITYIGPEKFGYIDKGDRVAMMIGTYFRADPFHAVKQLPRSARGEQAGFNKYVHSCDPPCKDLRDINISIAENAKKDNINAMDDGNLTEDEIPFNEPLGQGDD